MLAGGYVTCLITHGWRSAGRNGGFTLFARGIVCRDTGIARVSTPGFLDRDVAFVEE